MKSILIIDVWHLFFGVFFSIGFISLFIGMISLDTKENRVIKRKTGKSKYGEEHFKRNWRWAILWFGIIFCFIGILYCFNVFHLEDENEIIFSSKVDSIIWLMTIIGIVGAVWALFARIDAEKAFKGTNKILDALGTTFPFHEISYPDQILKIINTVGEENSEVSLFIGFPLVGFLYEIKENFNSSPESIFMTLNNKIDALKNNSNNFKFNLSIFSYSTTDQIFKKYCAANNISDENRNYIESEITEFYRRLNLIDGKKNIKIDKNMGDNENLRFASLKFLKSEYSFADKSIIWIVKNLEGSDVSFNSYCFQSSDTNLLAVLQTVFT